MSRFKIMFMDDGTIFSVDTEAYNKAGAVIPDGFLLASTDDFDDATTYVKAFRRILESTKETP